MNRIPKPGDLWVKHKAEIEGVDHQLSKEANAYAAWNIDSADLIAEQYSIFLEDYLEYQKKNEGWAMVSRGEVPTLVKRRHLEAALQIARHEYGSPPSI